MNLSLASVCADDDDTSNASKANAPVPTAMARDGASVLLGYPEAAPRLPRGYPEVTPRLPSSDGLVESWQVGFSFSLTH